MLIGIDQKGLLVWRWRLFGPSCRRRIPRQRQANERVWCLLARLLRPGLGKLPDDLQNWHWLLRGTPGGVLHHAPPIGTHFAARRYTDRQRQAGCLVRAQSCLGGLDGRLEYLARLRCGSRIGKRNDEDWKLIVRSMTVVFLCDFPDSSKFATTKMRTRQRQRSRFVIGPYAWRTY